MIEMPMRQQDTIQPPEAQPAAQNLPLRALSAVHQEAIFLKHHNLGTQPALYRWCAGGSTQEYNLEHRTLCAKVKLMDWRSTVMPVREHPLMLWLLVKPANIQPVNELPRHRMSNSY